MYFIARMPIEFYFENGNKVETTKFNVCVIFKNINQYVSRLIVFIMMDRVPLASLIENNRFCFNSESLFQKTYISIYMYNVIPLSPWEY